MSEGYQDPQDDPFANPLLAALNSSDFDEDSPRKGHKSMRPDYESEPPPVTLGEDGQYYANDNRWTPGVGWSTIVMEEPVYWVPGGVERSKVDEDHWEYDEFGNVVTKDADFAANDKAINPEGQWLNEEQIRQRWDSDFGMKNFKKANPDMTVDDFLAMSQETTALQAQGIEQFGEEGVNPEYTAVYDKYGVKTKYEGKDGALYEFNGGGYTLTRDPVDKTSNIMTGLALGIITAGVGAALAPAIGAAMPGLGAAGSKAASSAIINMAQQAMLTGGIDFKDALISAATSYGGAKLSEWIQESGIVDDLVGRSEKLQEIEQGLAAAGYTEEQIADAFLRNGIDPNNPGAATDILDKLLDLPVTDAIETIVGGGDRSDDVDYGGADSEITNETTQNEDGTWDEDWGVDVDITPPEFPEPPPEDDSTTGGGGAPDSGGAEGGDPADPVETVEPVDPQEPVGPDSDMDGEVVARSPEYYIIDENGDVYVIDPNSGEWNEDGTWGGEYRPEPVGNTNDPADPEAGSNPWWIGKDPGRYGEHGEPNIDPGQEFPTSDDPDFTIPDFLPEIPGYIPPTVPTDPSGGASGDVTAPPSTTPPGDSGGSQDGSGDLSGDSDSGEGEGESGDGDEGGDADGDNGEGESGNNGDGDGDDGTGRGDGGDGFDLGTGEGEGGGGMMSGGHDPAWGELFGYTPFKVYEPGRGLEPVSGLLKGLLK